MTKESYSGAKTLSDGTRVQMTAEEAEEWWRRVGESKAKLAADIPTTLDALTQINAARQRLRDLGWQQSPMFVADGTEVALIEEGSTGIFYGVWRKGYFHYEDCAARPKDGFYFKLRSNLTHAERERADECAKTHRERMDGFARSMAAIQELMEDGE